MFSSPFIIQFLVLETYLLSHGDLKSIVNVMKYKFLVYTSPPTPLEDGHLSDPLTPIRDANVSWSLKNWFVGVTQNYNVFQ